jgi:hypothetical protein
MTDQPIVTYEDHNLGDKMIFLHLLRALAKANPSRKFWHFTHEGHCKQLAPMVEDIANIELFTLGSAQWHEVATQAVNVWKNRGATDTRHHTGRYVAGFWEQSKNRWDWSAFTLEHHKYIAGLLGLRSTFTHRENLLFDYPALNPNAIGGTYFYDVLVVNSEPCSGQFGPMMQHGSGYLDAFVKLLARKLKVITTNPVQGVECTRDSKQTVTDIGRLSLLCRNHVMIATGPMWGTLNTTNHHHSLGRTRIVLLDNGEKLNMPGITQCASVAEAEQIARQEKWLS